MAKNDVILLDGIIEQRLAESVPSSERDEVFEFLVFDEFLKDYDLSRDEIDSGWIDGRSDGGVDGFYIFINGHLLDTPEEFAWPKSHASIELWLFTCKHHPSFKKAPVDTLVATFQELFDLAVESEDLKGEYSEELLRLRAIFGYAYKRLSIGRPELKINVIYGSRGDTHEIGEEVRARGRQVEHIFSSLFSSCNPAFIFAGAEELVQINRATKRFSLDLPFTEYFSTGNDSYVLLVKLREYWRFVSDEKRQLRRYLFDSNVRDYLGSNQVNEDIEKSLSDEDAPDFWWLNNGVTILATSATVPGKVIQLQDIQIVNGLQTTETIYNHFRSGATTSGDRTLLVKIIVSSDSTIRDGIIRATNNQSPVEIAALHATDKIQRDIEEILERADWYYERRRNYYRNNGKPQSRLVTPVYLASAVVALVFKNPARATRMKTRFMRVQSSYEAVFSSDLPLDLWPKLAEIYKRVDLALSKLPVRKGSGERFFATWRPLVSLLLVARHLGSFSYSQRQLLSMDLPPNVDGLVAEIANAIFTHRGALDRPFRPKPRMVQDICSAFAKEFGILGEVDIGRRQLPSADGSVPRPLSSEFVTSVEMVLPSQPWPPGTHLDVAAKLDCKPQAVSRAIQELIKKGRCKVQKDGIVYDASGLAVLVDPKRVPYTVEEINDQQTSAGDPS